MNTYLPAIIVILLIVIEYRLNLSEKFKFKKPKDELLIEEQWNLGEWGLAKKDWIWNLKTLPRSIFFGLISTAFCIPFFAIFRLFFDTRSLIAIIPSAFVFTYWFIYPIMISLAKPREPAFVFFNSMFFGLCAGIYAGSVWYLLGVNILVMASSMLLQLLFLPLKHPRIQKVWRWF